VKADDDSDAKVPLVQYHIYRRHFLAFRMSQHAFLDIKPEAMTEGLDKLIGEGYFSHHVYGIVTNNAQ
jgi:hypothetical protein